MEYDLAKVGECCLNIEERIEPAGGSPVEQAEEPDRVSPLNEGKEPERYPYHEKEEADPLDRYPDLMIFAAHFGGWKAWDEVLDCLAGCEHVRLGTSFTFGYIEPELFDRVLERHGTGRVMFGTDSPWNNQAEQIAHIQGLGLSRENEKQILAENTARFYNL